MRKDPKLVYQERAALASAFARLALASGWKAGYNPNPESSQWGVLYVDLPNGEQVSWHISSDDEPLVADLPQYQGQWDGKYTGRDPEWCLMVQHTPSLKG